jgi:hypothetical protein
VVVVAAACDSGAGPALAGTVRALATAGPPRPTATVIAPPASIVMVRRTL